MITITGIVIYVSLKNNLDRVSFLNGMKNGWVNKVTNN